MFKLPELSVKERSYVMYDVANSAITLAVVTVLFPLLQQFVARSEGIFDTYGDRFVSSTFMFLTSAIILVEALMSPFMLSLANYAGNKMKFFKIFMTMGMIGVAGLAIPTLSWVTLLVLFVIMSFGYNTANIIYDAFLIDVTTKSRMDKISSMGYAYGYIGSMIPFMLGIIPFALVTFGFLDESFYRISISFAFLLGLGWWWWYSRPIVNNVQQQYSIPKSDSMVKDSFGSIINIFKNFKLYKPIFLYLAAYLLYIDVVNSVIRLATTIGTDLNVGDVTLLLVVIIVQLVAFPSALIYGRVTKLYGPKRMIFFGIALYAVSIVVIWQLNSPDRLYFMYIVAVLVGLVQGGIQSISRSFFAQMVPAEKSNEFFGFFSVFGRFAGIFSPIILATLYQFEAISVNLSVLALLVPLSIGALLLAFVPDTRFDYSNEPTA
jgi:MFS transporter, UMF1 family